MLEGFLKGLSERRNTSMCSSNPLPVYGLAMGVIVLILGLMLWSREARGSASPSSSSLPHPRGRRFTTVSKVMTA